MGVDEVLAEVRGRLEGILAPINGGVGEDASYDEAFEFIKNELDKSSNIEGGSTDWNAVENKSVELLTDRSKDFRLALYYTAAACKMRKVPGLFDGLVVLLDLSNAFWDPMFPPLKRPRARGALCAWLSEVTTQTAKDYNPTAAERDMIKALERTFRELDNLLADKLGDAYPGMNTLRDAVNGLPHRVPADAPPPAPPAPVSAPRGSGPASVRAPSTIRPEAMPSYEQPVDYGGGGGGIGIALTDIVDPESAYRALTEVAPLVARAGDAILAGNATSADGFRLGRVGSWLLCSGTPYNEGGNTQIDGPPEHVVQGLVDMTAAQDWMTLLSSSAQFAAEYPLWLDASRALVLALENSGPDYEMAKNAVMREVGALVARAPELPDLKFLNGVAFANEDTKAWAKGLAAGGGGGGGGKSPVDKALVDANKLVVAGQINQAIGLLSRAANLVASPAHKFKARLEIGKICIKAGLVDIAHAQLEALDRVAEEHRLAAWDPELCAEMYANLYRARQAKSAQNTEDPDLPRKVAQSLQRLCELDAAQALLVMQEGASF